MFLKRKSLYFIGIIKWLHFEGNNSLKEGSKRQTVNTFARIYDNNDVKTWDNLLKDEHALVMAVVKYFLREKTKKSIISYLKVFIRHKNVGI